MNNYKVLMTSMALDIGGAETHLVELSKGLKDKGLDVYVASSGGYYEKELEDYGIKTFKVPLDSKNPIALVKSYVLLKKIITENNIKLVHSHTRIASHIIYQLQKRMHFRFVTTVHAFFSKKFPFNILSRWGEYALAVSDDIEEYLLDTYKVDKSKILRTVNGINREVFNEDIEVTELEKEYGKSEHKIVYMSRMDKDMSLTAKLLIQLAPKLVEDYKDIKIFIIGGGNDFDFINNKAQDMNKKIGKDIIIVTGPRSDVNKFLVYGDIFIGVSRSSLEAMATNTPVILSGNQGYLGAFTKDKLDLAISTNFCCRDEIQPNEDVLYEDIKFYFSKELKEKRELTKFYAELIESQYGVEKMVQDSLDVYEKVRYSPRKIDVMISGYYGFKNNGDDILLKSIISDLKKLKEDINIIVLSKTPKETEEIYRVKSINRFNVFAIWKSLKDTNLLLSGGGTLIQDQTSTNSLFYYLFVIRSGMHNGSKTMLYANGMGPINNERNRRLSKKVLDKMDMITLRDEEAKKELDRLKVDNKNVEVTIDPAFTLDLADKTEKIYENYFVVSIRSWKYVGEDFEEELSIFCDAIYDKYGLTPVFMSMQPVNDTPISKRVLSKMKNKGIMFKDNYSMNEVISLIKYSDFVIGMRLHTIIYSIKENTPLVGLVYDPKVEGIMKEIGQDTYVFVEDLKAVDLCKHIDYIVENRADIVEDFKKFNIKAYNTAMKTPQLAIELIDEKEF